MIYDEAIKEIKTKIHLAEYFDEDDVYCISVDTLKKVLELIELAKGEKIND